MMLTNLKMINCIKIAIINKNKAFIRCALGVILLSALCFACTNKKIINVTPREQTSKLKQEYSHQERDFSKRTYRTDFKKLKHTAENLIHQKNYTKALYIYNKLLAISHKKDKINVLKTIDQVLTKVDPEIIREIAKSKENLIPIPILMYRFGVNLISSGKYKEARKILTDFIEKYPDNFHVHNALDILKILKEHEFKKNIIGCMLPLSGRFSIFGQRALRGIEMAVHDLSKDYSQKIIIVVKDTRSDDDCAVQCVKELAAKNVAAIAGPMITAGAAGEKAEQFGIPMIVMTQKQQITAEGEYIFSNFLTPEMQTKALVSFAVRHLGIKKFAILYPDDRYGKTYMGLFQNMVDEENGYISGSESYIDGQTDFSRVIKKLIKCSDNFVIPDSLNDSFNGSFNNSLQLDENSGVEDSMVNNENHEKKIQEQFKAEIKHSVINFQAIFIPDKSFNVSLILPQLAYNDIKGVYLLGTNIWHDKTLLKNAAKYAKNSIITEGYFAQSRNIKSRDFAKRFNDIYNEEPRFIEAVAYDTASMLIKTAMDPEINSRKALRNALSGKRMFDGVTGKTIFDENGNARRELFFLTVKKGKFVEISR